MSSPELVTSGEEHEKTPLIHREDIPFEKAIRFQNKLAREMAPERLAPYISEGDPETGEPITPIEVAYANLWMNRYADPEGTYNGFTSFCDNDTLSTNEVSHFEIKQRIKDGLTTKDDLRFVSKFIEAEAGPLFTSEDEVNDFLKQYVH